MTFSRFLDLLFGARPTDEDAARRLAARPPRPVWTVLLVMRLTLLVWLSASLLGIKDRLPHAGPWLASNEGYEFVFLVALILIPWGVDSFYERRAARRHLSPPRS
ncbi:MAG: hypothetical protein KKF88_06905 [Alphaproteobacteria bacterium]|nr:hypothetical protein [Alphaproteobacteria bacterium]